MTPPAPDSSADLTAVLEQVGVTNEGKRRARARWLAAEARWTPEHWTPEHWAQLRTGLGRPRAPRE